MNKVIKKTLKSRLLAPFLSGLLIVFAFPPFPTGFLAWFALLPLIYSYYRDDFHLGFEKSFIFGAVLNLGILYWLAVNQGTQWYYSTLSMLSSVLFLALFYGIAGSVIGYIGRKSGKTAGILALPFVLTAMEWLRSLSTLGFTWNNLCYTQSTNLPLLQILSFTGPFGLSFWIYMINALLFLIIMNWKTEGYRLISIFIIIFIFPLLYGLIVLHGTGNITDSKNKNVLAVTVVQPNVDPNAKWDKSFYKDNIKKLLTLSEAGIAENQSKLIIWPETAVPTYLRINRRNSLEELRKFSKEHGIFVITGAPDYYFNKKNDEYEFYNSVFFINPTEPSPEIYRKMHLVPFGEYIPLSEHFTSLKKLNLGQGNFIAGKEITIFNLENNVFPVDMTAAVCFESSFSNLIRKGVKKGSHLLAVVTNDAWFGNTSAPYLHAHIARFRAVENRIPVVRAANTGISMIIDSYGRVIKKSKFAEEKQLSAKIIITKNKTFYTKTGNWIGIFCVIMVLFFIGQPFFRRKNAK